MKNNKMYDEYLMLNKQIDICIDTMFKCIDENNVNMFSIFYKMFFETRSKLYKNKYNQCGHKLCDEIENFAKCNNIS